MHILTNKNPLPIGGGVSLLPGRYLLDDVDAGEALRKSPGGELLLQAFTLPKPLSGESGIPDAGRFTVIRPGRFGDLVLLTPCLRHIKTKWPKCFLQLCCLPSYRDAVVGLPYIDNFLPYPLPMDEARSNPDIHSLEPLASLVDRERELHITDLFAERLGLEGIENKKPDFFLSNDERNWAHEVYPRTKHKRVAIQLKSSTPSRDYPKEQMAEVLKRLHGRNWDVVLLGTPEQIVGQSEDRMTNCANDKLTFRQSAAVLATADVFLGPDSSLIHVAGALGTPAVGLFSVVPWELRTKYCPTTFVIQAKKGCDIAPCFHAPRGAVGFPSNGPCVEAKKCCALAMIDPQQVVAKVEQSVR